MLEYRLGDEQLRRRLLQTQYRGLTLELMEALAWAGTVAAGVLLAIVVGEALLFASSPVRKWLWYGWLGLTAIVVVAAVAPKLARLLGVLPREPLEHLALRIGRLYPHIGDMLCNVLQLMAQLRRQPQGTSAELVLAAFAQVASRAQEVNFDAILDRRRTQRVLLLFFGVLGAVALLIGTVPPLRSAFHRIVAWERSFVPPAPFRLSLEPSEAVVMRGTPVRILVRASGVPPATVRLFLWPETGQQQVRELAAEAPGVFSAELGPVVVTMRFAAVAQWMGQEVWSPEGLLRVVDRPLVRALSGEIRPPAYTRLDPIRLDEHSSELVVPRGSVASLSVEASKALRTATVIFLREGKQDTLRYPLHVSGTTARGSFPISSSGRWAVVLHDSDGQTNASPLWYRVTALEDAPPQISFVEPTADVELSETAILPIRVSIRDDYGFSRLLLHYRLSFSRYVPPQTTFRTLTLPLVSTSTLQEVPYVWDLKPLKLSPDDRYEFFVEVWDNDAITGPKAARTPVLSISLPSLEQVLRRSEGLQQSVAETLQESIRQFEQLRRQGEELYRRLSSPTARQPQQQAEQQRQFQELLQQHQQLQEQLGQVQQQLQQIAQRLEQVRALSPETLEKYRELQRLLQEVRSPELQRLLERLQQALQQMTPEQMQQALRQFRFNEEEFRAALERTLRLLKRLQAEQKLDALRQQLDRLAERQEELHRETERAEAAERLSELARQQEELQAEWQRLQQEWQQTEKLLREVIPETPSEALAQATEQMSSSQTGEALQQARSSLQRGQRGQAQQAQRRAASQMRSAAAAVQRLWDELQRQLTREVQRQLQKALLDAVELSQQQEQLYDRTRPLPPGSRRLAEIARQQAELRSATGALTERLMAVAQKSFAVTPQMARELGLALRSMQQAMTHLGERSTSPAAQAQQEAMEALNRATLLLQDALSALQAAAAGACPNPGMGQGAGGMGFLERLQQLALQQQGITQALQQLFQGRLTMEQQAQLARLAAQQAYVQQSLEELARQQNLPGGERLLGDLSRLAEEMRQVVEQLRSGTLTEETLRRQHRILVRMLDAMRSIYERDYEPRRESRPGQNIVRPSPPELPAERRTLLVPEELLPALQRTYSRDYQRLIERYFEQLRRYGFVNP